MKKIVLFLMLVSLSTSALAFGGLFGGSKKSGRHSTGVDNFGAHIKPDQPTPPNIGFYDISKDENAVLCAEGSNIYCCKSGYVIDLNTTVCVPCPENEVATVEENFQCTACQNEQVPSEDKSVCIMPESVCSADNPSLCLDEVACLEVGAVWCNGQCQSSEVVCCPDAGILAEGGMGIESCCKDNLAYDSESATYKAYEPTVCGCPNDAKYHPEGGFCCDGPWTLSYYKGKIVNIMNPEQCGCRFADMLKIDETGKKYCCGTSKNYDFGQDYSMSRGYLPKASQFCCESVGGRWCADTSECVTQKESCSCSGTGNGCQTCDENGLIPDESKNGQLCGTNGMCENGVCKVCDINNLDLCETPEMCAPHGAWCNGQCQEKEIRCCMPSATVNEQNDCCIGAVCANEKEELYCQNTDELNNCITWDVCAIGYSASADAPKATGACAQEGQEVYCRKTNNQGQCEKWAVCWKQGLSTTDRIVDVPNAEGVCGGSSDELYCKQTNEKGECSLWDKCTRGQSTGETIISIPNASGQCNA